MLHTDLVSGGSKKLHITMIFPNLYPRADSFCSTIWQNTGKRGKLKYIVTYKKRLLSDKMGEIV